jgi:hypothetical protein
MFEPVRSIEVVMQYPILGFHPCVNKIPFEAAVFTKENMSQALATKEKTSMARDGLLWVNINNQMI